MMRNLICSLVLTWIFATAWGASTSPHVINLPGETKTSGFQSEVPDSLPKPLKVSVALILNSILSMDEKSGDFEADVDLTIHWGDPGMAFNAAQEGSTMQKFEGQAAEEKLKTFWNPNVTISNVEKIVSSNPTLFISAQGIVTEIRRMKAIFHMTPDLKAFPFDTQYLTFDLDAPNNTINEIQFLQHQEDIDRSGIREGVRLKGWTLNTIEFENSVVRNAAGGFYPRFEASIVMAREPGSHLFAFAPLFLIMLAPTIITLYSKESTIGGRLTAWGAALLTLIAVSFALDQKYPALESDSILPQIISIVLIYQFIMIFVTMTIVNPVFVRKVKNPYLIPSLLFYLQWTIPIAFILLIVSRILLVGTQF